ncbi:acetyltransferase, GNAT family [Aspergillus piperis CBS 112811]|uniref:Acetyltransferase, GNAT family n=1 Tax=Aspergillus piperis CBS 112811 TaxID=1448313 RepID=A0A8G1QW64_9EURO|nr:acetyltransferase, GNAT family [Aspergillus piperis CBS 112811]RAH54789.1 acetyltransferase, GNAT family [Aspergillus piperis CBS 112811]
MSTTTKQPTFTTTLIPPPGPSPNPPLTVPPPTTTLTTPTDPLTTALLIRRDVFIHEQNCTPDGEIDSDDPRSWQWVVYAQHQDAETTPTPVAVIRLVPPPHAPHEILTHPETASSLPKWDLKSEPYVKLTRVAVVKEWRGYGLGRVLVDEALRWAAQNPGEIQQAFRDVAGVEGEWKGLVLVHAQVQVEGMYKRLGFETDEALGRWDEEGIEHVGMWRRVSVGSS